MDSPLNPIFYFFSESVLSSSLEAREACRSLNGSSVVFHDSPEEDRLQLRSRHALSKAESSTSGFLALFRPETVRHPPTLHLDTLGSSHHKTDRAESLQPGRYGNDSKIRPVVEKKRKEKHVQSFFFFYVLPSVFLFSLELFFNDARVLRTFILTMNLIRVLLYFIHLFLMKQRSPRLPSSGENLKSR